MRDHIAAAIVQPRSRCHTQAGCEINTAHACCHRLITRKPLPRVTTACHARKGCCVSLYPRPAGGITAVAAKSASTSHMATIAALLAMQSTAKKGNAAPFSAWETAQAVQRPTFIACTAAKQTMSHTMRIRPGWGATPIQSAAHEMLLSAANIGGSAALS